MIKRRGPPCQFAEQLDHKRITQSFHKMKKGQGCIACNTFHANSNDDSNDDSIILAGRTHFIRTDNVNFDTSFTSSCFFFSQHASVHIFLLTGLSLALGHVYFSNTRIKRSL